MESNHAFRRLPMNVSAALKSVRETHSSDQLHRMRYFVDLVSNLVARDMKFRYKGSILGMLWSLLQPMCIIAVYSFLFTRVMSLNIPNYVSFLVVGVLPWNWFAVSLDFSADALVGNRDLVKRATFPNEILVAATITSNLVILALALPVLFVFLVISGIPISATIIMLPVLIALQYSFLLGLGLVLSTMQVYFRDIRHLLGVVVFAWFFLTPVFYDSAQVPARYSILYSANPMAHIINSYRDVLLFGRWPSFYLLAQVALISAIILVFGLKVFRRYKSGFPEEL